jgi:hypothetical protein
MSSIIITACFNIVRDYVLPTEYICVFHDTKNKERVFP